MSIRTRHLELLQRLTSEPRLRSYHKQKRYPSIYLNGEGEFLLSYRNISPDKGYGIVYKELSFYIPCRDDKVCFGEANYYGEDIRANYQSTHISYTQMIRKVEFCMKGNHTCEGKRSSIIRFQFPESGEGIDWFEDQDRNGMLEIAFEILVQDQSEKTCLSLSRILL